MKAVLCETLGPPSSLVVRDLPDPRAGSGEVVVDVAWCALNFFDTLIIAAMWAFRRRREIAGWWQERRPDRQALSAAPEAGRALPGE